METATEAIRGGLLPPPPELSASLIAEQGQLAEAAGMRLEPCRQFTRYGGKNEGPILLVTDAVIELLDEYEPVAGAARLAASHGGAWFLVLPESGDEDDAPRALTWVYANGEWMLASEEQYLA